MAYRCRGLWLGCCEGTSSTGILEWFLHLEFLREGKRITQLIVLLIVVFTILNVYIVNV